MPRMKFADIYSHIETITNVTNKRSLIKDCVQMALDRISSAGNLKHLEEEVFVTTIATYTTGTVTVTNSSTTVTGSGTTFTSAMVGRKFRRSGDNAYYRISAYVSATEITLEVAYQGTTNSAQNYTIYQDEYRLRADLDVAKVMRQIENAVAQVGVESSAFDIISPTPTAVGSPAYNIMVGSKRDTYATGTVSGTVGASVITGASTSWTSVQGLSRGNRVVVGTNVYTIKSVDSDTQLTIYEDLAATISAGTAYTINLDNYIIQFYSIPDTAENIYYRYQRTPEVMYNDTDIPDLPDNWHWVLIVGGSIWPWWTKNTEEATKTAAYFEVLIGQVVDRLQTISTNVAHPRRTIAGGDDNYYSIIPPTYGRPVTF